MSTTPIETLEEKAREERTQLHHRANELRTQARIVRDHLDITRNARRHFGAAAAIVMGLGLLSGYAAAGLFTRR